MEKKRLAGRKAQNSDVDGRLVELELEISKFNREKSVMVLNKAVFLYFIFLVVAIIGILKGYKDFFNILILMGLCVLLTGAFPYIKTMYDEERKLQTLAARLRAQK